MAAIAGLIGAQVVGGIGNNIAEGLREQQRRNEWNKMFDLQNNKFMFEKDFSNRQLNQNNELTRRGQDLNFGSHLMGSAMNVGSSLFGNLLSYKNAQDQLNFSKELNQQRRSDLQNEGVPLSYLHVGGSLQRSMGGGIPMQRTQTFGRDTSNPWGFANSGPNLRQTYTNDPPPTYSQSQSNANRPGFDQNGWPK